MKGLKANDSVEGLSVSIKVNMSWEKSKSRGFDKSMLKELFLWKISNFKKDYPKRETMIMFIM